MAKQRTYCFTKPTEMNGILPYASWAHSNMRSAINMGTGPWFCLFVEGKPRANVEMGNFLVKLGFEAAYEFVKTDRDALALANTALKWRNGTWKRGKVDNLLSDLQQKYARNFESRPLIVAARLAQENPCAVASAMCIDGVGTDFEVVTGAIIDYARRVIRP